MAYYQPQHFYPQQPQPILNGYYGVPEQFLVPFYSTAIPQPVPATVYPSIKDSSEHKKLFIGGIRYDTTYDDLQIYFSQFGEIECIDLRRFPFSSNSRGFAFVMFKTIEGANNVLACNHHILKNKVIDIKKSIPRSFTMKLIVKGLDRTITSHDIRTYFERYAPVLHVLMLTDKQNNQPRDFCFVTLFTRVEASSIIIYRHHVINGKQVAVTKVVKEIDESKSKFIRRN